MPNPNPAVNAEPPVAETSDLRLISKPALCALFGGVSPRYIDALVKARRLGAPIKLSPKVSRFRLADVSRFLAEQESAAS